MFSYGNLSFLRDLYYYFRPWCSVFPLALSFGTGLSYNTRYLSRRWAKDIGQFAKRR
jgi:hypothetical protein